MDLHRIRFTYIAVVVLVGLMALEEMVDMGLLVAVAVAA
jgi:hypothetical protein